MRRARCANRPETFEPTEIWRGVVVVAEDPYRELVLAFTRLEPGSIEGRLTIGSGPGGYFRVSDVHVPTNAPDTA